MFHPAIEQKDQQVVYFTGLEHVHLSFNGICPVGSHSIRGPKSESLPGGWLYRTHGLSI